MNKISGVYKITNVITGDFYIGSSKNIKQRWNDHKKPSVWTRYSNSMLYRYMAQFGLSSFSFEIVEETSALKEREQYWIDKLQPKYNNYRAKGLDVERQKKSHKKASKKYCELHLEERKAQYKKYYESHSEKCKAYNNQLCLYNDEKLTLSALRRRFSRKCIPNPTQEAKKYLINN